MSDNKYKKAMNDVCDRNFNVSAAEMLEKARSAAPTERNITMTGTSKKHLIGKFIGAAAACVIISGTAASAMGYGPLGDSFRRFFGKDETTAEIIDEGHYCEVGQDITDGGFTVMLDSVTGDRSSPKLLFEVTVNDEELAAKNDRLHLFAYILDEDTYQNRLDEYGMWDAWGEKDPEVNNMYHVCMDGPATFMINNADVLAAVKQISFPSDPVNHKFDYDVDMEFRFTVPEQALKETAYEYYDDITISSGNVDYELFYAEFGAYDSLLKVKYDFLGTDLAGGETDYYQVADKFDNDWHELAGNFILTVDGVEYAPKEMGYSYCDTEGEAFDAGKCSTWMTFPSVDFTSAESVTLTVNGQVYDLK